MIEYICKSWSRQVDEFYCNWGARSILVPRPTSEFEMTIVNDGWDYWPDDIFPVKHGNKMIEVRIISVYWDDQIVNITGEVYHGR